MSAKALAYVRSLWVVPALFAFFYAIRVLGRYYGIDDWLPKSDTLAIILVMIILERTVRYKYAVSQRSLLPRDVGATLVNLYVTGFVTGLIVLPLLALLPEQALGREHVFASPEQLGPFWFQFLVIAVSVSFFRYWMHRVQHAVPFLWALHSYHHRVTDLQGSNTFVSHPIDFALRNVLVFLLLGLVGFNPLAILVAVPATNISGTFSHCGADLKGGILNYVFVTPEVHRWHHTAKVPEGYGYSCNYGVEFSFWDILFGTFYLPKKDGQFLQPELIGHPSGLPDEGNYVKLLLAPLGLYRPMPWLKRFLRIHSGPKGHLPAE
jgi:sterol desaturase/sphingolipid hydroxylase (fatty acid hydroxylase superfamily)